jgi:hypothetical protein
MLDETVGVVPQSLHRDRKGPIWLVSCGHVRKRWIRPLRCTGAPSLPDPTPPARLIAMQHSNAMRRRPDKLADIPGTPMRGVKEARTCLSGGRRLLPLWQARNACCPANDVHNSNCHDWNWRSSESRVGEEFCSSRRPHCMRLTASQRPSAETLSRLELERTARHGFGHDTRLPARWTWGLGGVMVSARPEPRSLPV